MRVVSLHPAATELVFALGASTLLVGRTDACAYPEAALRIPSVGPFLMDSADQSRKEMLAVLEPDIVLVGDGQEALAAALENDYDLLRVAPRTMEEVKDVILRVGALFSKQVEADMLVHEIAQAFDRVKERSSRFQKVRALMVRCQDGGIERPPLYALEIIDAARGEPYLGDATPERLGEFGPRMIIAVRHGSAGAAQDDDEEHCVERISSRDGWQTLPAVQQELVFVMDEGLLRPTPRLIEGMRLLARILHGVEI